MGHQGAADLLRLRTRIDGDHIDFGIVGLPLLAATKPDTLAPLSLPHTVAAGSELAGRRSKESPSNKMVE